MFFHSSIFVVVVDWISPACFNSHTCTKGHQIGDYNDAMCPATLSEEQITADAYWLHRYNGIKLLSGQKGNKRKEKRIRIWITIYADDPVQRNT